MNWAQHKAKLRGLRRAAFEVIFEAETPAGRLSYVVLITAIVASVAVVMLDTVGEVRARYGPTLYALEWFFTILFTVEYVVRLWCVGNAPRYAVSFYGLVDLLAVAPTYLSLLVTGTQYLLVIRLLRVLRVFRVLKLTQCTQESQTLVRALSVSRRRIFVFLFTVLTLVVIIGAVIYLIEGPENGFTSIPKSVYWAIVTLTTVGYGDISPRTAVGQLLASMVMILGYSIIAVPTGIVTVELARGERAVMTSHVCPQCRREGHDVDAVYCKYCGSRL